MAVRHVSNSGVNSGSGTIGSPWQTFDYAQSNAVSGDEVLFLSGNTFNPQNINKSNITYGKYGGDAKPIISAFTTLTGWVNQGNGIWTCTNTNLGSTLKKITIGGNHANIGRSVKFNETDHGYLTISSGTTTSLSNTAIGTGPNFVGGSLTFKSSLYTVDVLTITGQSGNTLTFSGSLSYGAAKNGYGFIIANHPNTLTQFGEWSYNSGTKTVSMFFGANNPSSYTIKASRYENCITTNGGINNVTFNDIIFEGSNGDAIKVGGANTFKFDRCEVRQSGRDGINAVNHPNLSVLNSHVHDCNNNGVWTTVGSSNAIVFNNLVENIGLDLPLTNGGLNNGGGYGLHIPWGGSIITYNTVRNCAGVGIRYEKAFSQCSYNHVYNVLNRFADLGGIYNWNGSTNLDKQPGMRCIFNHVHDIYGANYGTTYSQSTPLSHGIYEDDHSSGEVDNAHQIWNNVVYNIGGNGFNLRNVESMHLQNNLAFNCDQALRIVGDQDDEFIEDLRFNGNILIAKESTKDVMGLYNNHGSIYNWLAVIPGTPDVSRWNNNVYGRPIANTGNMFKTQNVGSVVSRDFAGLKTYLGWDQDSILTPVTIDNVDKFRLETNYSDTPLTVDLSDGSYVDMYGVEQPLSIELQPYEGTLLIRTSETPPNPNPFIPIKEVYTDGFYNDVDDDTNPVVPAIKDVVLTTSQMHDPSFVTWDAGLNAARFYMEIISPTLTSSYAGRTEHNTNYPSVRNSEEVWFSISYRVPTGEGSDPLEEVIYQWHNGSGGGSPPFALWRRNARFLVFFNLASRTLAFDLGPATQNVWHDFIIKLDFATDLTGGLTVWKDGQLARCYNPVTNVMWQVPTSSPGGGVSSTYVLGASTGAILQTVEEGGNTVSVLVYEGITARTSPNNTKYPKWGLYKSGWGNTRVDDSGNVRPGVYDSEDPIYVAPENREKILFIKNVKFETRTLEHTYIYKSLDVNNDVPLEEPVWWEDGVVDTPPTITLLTPVNNRMIIYPTTINLTVDVVAGTNAIQKVDYYNGASLIGTSTVAPYSYDWINPTAGIKDITAIVTDINGLTDTSNLSTITVYNFIDGEGDFRMFLNEGTSSTETYNGENYIGALNFYQGQSLIDNVSPDTLEPIFLTGRAYYNLNYAIPVPNGSYTIKTYHNEPYWGVNDGGSPGPNKRVFDIFLEGNLVYNDFDIYVVNNSENTILTFNDIVVTDGVLNLDMVASIDMANLSALSIEPYTLPNESPVAIATSDINSGDAPLTVMFTGDQSTDDVGIITYRWEFGDGNGSDFANEEHIYGTPGEYTAVLTVTDIDGLSSNTSILINVNEVVPINEPPVAIALSNITNGDFPLTVNFNGSSSTDDVGIVSYLWDFQDSSTSTEINPLHTFSSIGTYEVTLTVEDEEGLDDTDTITITVTGPIFDPPTIDITSPNDTQVFLEGDIIYFTIIADDENEQITSVKFYVNDVEVDEVLNEPYTTNLNLLEGSYELYTEAFNNDLSLIISDSINITVNKVVSDIIINTVTGGTSEVLTTPYNEDGEFAEDMTINIKATPLLGYTFSHWIIALTPGNPQVVGSGQLNYSFNMPANDVTITPVFDEPIIPDGSYFTIRGNYQLYNPS